MNIFELSSELTQIYAELTKLRLVYSEVIDKFGEVEKEVMQHYQVRLAENFKKVGSSTAAKAQAEYEKTLHPKYDEYMKLKIKLQKLDKELKLIENQIKILNSLQYLQTVEAKYT